MQMQHLIIENFKLLSKSCPLEKIQILNDSIVITVKSDIIFDILLFLKNHVLYQFELLTCISGVDFPNNKYRFNIVYELLSLRYMNRSYQKFLILWMKVSKKRE